MTNARTLGLAFTMLLGAVTVASAQQPTLLQQFDRWTSYTYTGKGKVCYAITQPTETAPKGLNRDPAFAFVTNRPKEGVKHEFSIETGYPYKEGSKTTVKIGDDTFVLFTNATGAWVENAAEESRLIDAMKAGSDMVVTGTSRRGTVTTDTYSLKGISAALKRIDTECK
jgi:hypothetical protein